MHFEVLIEDQSGSIAVDAVLGKILGRNGALHSWKVHGYKGLGHIPKGLRGKTDPAKRILLDRLPKLLRGYGKNPDASSAVVVVVDLDNRDCMAFKRELLAVLNACRPAPDDAVPDRHRGNRGMAAGRPRRREGRLSPRQGCGAGPLSAR